MHNSRAVIRFFSPSLGRIEKPRMGEIKCSIPAFVQNQSGQFRLDAFDRRKVSSVRRHRLVLHRSRVIFFPTAPFHLREYRSSPTIANRRQSARPILSDLVDYVIQVNASAYTGPFRGRVAIICRLINRYPCACENILLMSNGCVESNRTFPFLFIPTINQEPIYANRIFSEQATCALLG